MSIDYNSSAILAEQRRICEKYGANFLPVSVDMKVGFSFSIKDGERPINGLRHPVEMQASGWFFWGGESLSDEVDFFSPLHIWHLTDYCPQILPYLGLPPGWRFLIDDFGYEDVWFDEKLLNT